MDEVLLALCGLTVKRGCVTLLDRIDWRVERGQHWVMLGANGCGKTSLIQTLTGYLTPSGGTMEVLGGRYGECDWRELRLRVGLVSSALQAAVPAEEAAAVTVMSGKFAQLGHWGAGRAADLRVAKRRLATMGLGRLAERAWGVLSQGERQRVLIARALMARPALLILDEPCAGLDPVARREFLEFLETMAAGGAGKAGPSALVLVTHHVEEITPAFTHALVMKQGRVWAAGRREKVLTSQVLSEAFGAPLRLRRRAGRLELCHDNLDTNDAGLPGTVRGATLGG